MSSFNRQDMLLDSLEERIIQARDDLELFQEGYSQCRQLLSTELDKRKRLDVENLVLQRRNAQLESELKHVKTTMLSAHSTNGHSSQLRMAQPEISLSEKIEILKAELKDAQNQVLESDRLVQNSVKRSIDIAGSLLLCGKKLEPSRSPNQQLLADPHACGKGSNCKVHPDERTSHRERILERSIETVNIDLYKSERLAEEAEASLKKLEEARERLESRWHDRLHEFSITVKKAFESCNNSKGFQNS